MRSCARTGPGVISLVVERGAAIKPPGDVIVADVLREAPATRSSRRCATWASTATAPSRSWRSMPTVPNAPRSGATSSGAVPTQSCGRSCRPGPGRRPAVGGVLLLHGGRRAHRDDRHRRRLHRPHRRGDGGGPGIRAASGVRGGDLPPPARRARTALAALVVGLALAIVVSAVATAAFDSVDADIVEPVDRFFTSFVHRAEPVLGDRAFAAGLVGIMAIGLGRSGALTGVVVSVTTIPAAADRRERGARLVGRRVARRAPAHDQGAGRAAPRAPPTRTTPPAHTPQEPGTAAPAGGRPTPGGGKVYQSGHIHRGGEPARRLRHHLVGLPRRPQLPVYTEYLDPEFRADFDEELAERQALIDERRAAAGLDPVHR